MGVGGGVLIIIVAVLVLVVIRERNARLRNRVAASGSLSASDLSGASRGTMSPPQYYEAAHARTNSMVTVVV